MALPSNVSFGTVTGTFIRGVADSPIDDDRDPEASPINALTITFTPAIAPAVVRDTSTSPPITLLIDPVSCVTNASGTLVGPDGQPGVNLIASANTALDPTGWTWTVSIQSATFPQIQFNFNLAPGATVDLATVARVAGSSGVSGGVGAPVGGGSSGTTTVDNGDGTFTSSGTTTVDNGDGTFNLSGSTVTDNGDGTFNLAA